MSTSIWYVLANITFVVFFTWELILAFRPKSKHQWPWIDVVAMFALAVSIATQPNTSFTTRAIMTLCILIIAVSDAFRTKYELALKAKHQGHTRLYAIWQLAELILLGVVVVVSFN